MTEDEKKGVQAETLEAVKTWFSICYRGWLFDTEGAKTPKGFVPDLVHSALLQRLLKGINPIPVAPPLAYSYPWYALYDSEDPVSAVDVWYSENFKGLGENYIVINQGIWKVVKEVTPNDEYIIRWREEEGHPLFRVWKSHTGGTKWGQWTLERYKEDL